MTNVVIFPSMPRKTAFEAPNRVREIRTALGLTLEQVVDRLDHSISLNQISRIERGTSQLTHQVQKRIAEALEVSPADLLLPEHGGLTERERQLIETYREVPEAVRAGFDALRESAQPYRGQPEVVDLAHRKSG